MGKKSESGMSIPDYISESLGTIFWVKMLKDRYEKIRILGPVSTSRIRNTVVSLTNQFRLSCMMHVHHGINDSSAIVGFVI
jgi:hypothetical protein